MLNTNTKEEIVKCDECKECLPMESRLAPFYCRHWTRVDGKVIEIYHPENCIGCIFGKRRIAR